MEGGAEVNSLPNDIARCNGDGSDEEGWREGCETCLRRTAPRPEECWMMAPPSIIAFECEYLIEPKNKTND
jgi:hypothetical protein